MNVRTCVARFFRDTCTAPCQEKQILFPYNLLSLIKKCHKLLLRTLCRRRTPVRAAVVCRALLAGGGHGVTALPMRSRGPPSLKLRRTRARDPTKVATGPAAHNRRYVKDQPFRHSRNGNIILHLRFDAQAEVSSFGFLVSSFWVSGYDNAQQVQCGRFLARPSQA